LLPTSPAITSACYPAFAVILACTSIAAILAAISDCTAVIKTAAITTRLYAFSLKHTSRAPFF
jgi:hypothetical protein